MSNVPNGHVDDARYLEIADLLIYILGDRATSVAEYELASSTGQRRTVWEAVTKALAQRLEETSSDE